MKLLRSVSAQCAFSLRSRIGAVLACIALTTVVSPARAQFIVNDPPALATALEGIGKDILEYGEQAKRWTDTYKHYNQQLIKLQRLQLRRTQLTDDFPERDLEYGMDDLCPGPPGASFSIQGLMSQFNPQMQSDVVKEQRRLCQRIVLADNTKYNESVRMLKKLIERNREFNDIENQRDEVGDSQGKLAANDNEAQRFMVRTKMDLDYWQARMKAYDDYIVALQKDQGRLARRALEGKQEGGIGKIIQTEVLRQAFAF
ncbi:MAG: hypothetical protein ACREP7_01370 [Lysobacter sp.]